MMKSELIILFGIIALVLISGCIQQEAAIEEASLEKLEPIKGGGYCEKVSDCQFLGGWVLEYKGEEYGPCTCISKEIMEEGIEIEALNVSCKDFTCTCVNNVCTAIERKVTTSPSFIDEVEEAIKNQMLARATTEIVLDIRFPKDVYTIGESVEGAEYYMKYDGEPFSGIVLYTKSSEDKKYYSMAYGLIEDVDFDDPQKTHRLKEALNVEDHFQDEGTYTYSISIYECYTIKKELNKPCQITGPGESVTGEELVTIPALKSKSKSIRII